jgi:uroporphyrinogen III methyltransferase/synthase
MKKTTPKNKGICHLAGAGPGDLGLVTLRVKELVEQAEVIVYDYLCNPEILRWARADAEIIYAGKKAGAHTLKQEEIDALLGRCVSLRPRRRGGGGAGGSGAAV